jgi:radical SAM superfamily enzyme YgiQ (UPF0313 family)
MRILLVVPPWRTTDALVADLYPMPYAAVLLGTVLREKGGHDVVIKDFLVPPQKHREAVRPPVFAGKHAPPYVHYGWPMQDCFKWLEENLKGFDVVGLMGGQCNLFETVFDLGRFISVQAPLVVGGAYATTAPRQVAEGTGAQVVVVGEGERAAGAAFAAAMQRFDKSMQEPAIIKGLPVEDLNSLPVPDWNLVDLDEYPNAQGRVRGVLSVARGCPYHCSYCSVHTVHGRNHRRKDMSHIVEELANLGQHGVGYYCFLDDNLFIDNRSVQVVLKAINYAKAHELIPPTSRFYVEEGIEIRIASKPGVMAALQGAGFVNIALGMESLNEGARRAVQKPYQPSHLKEALEECRVSEVVPRMFYIVGLPGDTLESLARDLVRFGRMGVAVRPNNLKLYPGTKITRQFISRGIIDDTYDWRLSGFWTPDTRDLAWDHIRRFKTRLRAVGMAAEMGVRLFGDRFEVMADIFEKAGFKLDIGLGDHIGEVTIAGNMFRPTPYKYMAEMLCLRLGVAGAVVTVKDLAHGGASNKAVVAAPAPRAVGPVQEAVREAIQQEEAML